MGLHSTPNFLDVWPIVWFHKNYIHTPTTEGHWKFRGGRGFKGQNCLIKESMSLNWNFQRAGGLKPKHPP